VIACNLLALLFRQAVNTILRQSIVWNTGQCVIVQAFDILIYTLAERSLTGILSVGIHHAVITRALHDDIELMEE
jgi:hypothetical protein